MKGEKKAILIQQRPEVFEIMHDLKYKIMQAEDSIEGIRKTIRYRPNLVLGEVDTAQLSGLSMAKVLQMLQLKVPLILMAQSKKYENIEFEKQSNILAVLNYEEVQYRLSQTIVGGLKNYHPEEAEYTYTFRQREWSDLISLSGRKRILLIEDHEETRKAVLIKIDRSNEYEMYSAVNGLDGLLKALLIKPDLILSNIVMPALDGLVMSQIFFILNKPFPIVFLTAQEDKGILKKAAGIESVLGIIHKREVRNSSSFLATIASYLHEAEKRHQSLDATYQKEEMRTLLRSDRKEGGLALNKITDF